MADNNQREDEQSAHGERRQSARAREEVRNRAGEDKSMHDDPSGRLGDLDEALRTHDYPTTTDELVEAYGDFEIETQGGEESLAEVLASTDNQTFDSDDDARSRILGLIHR